MKTSILLTTLFFLLMSPPICFAYEHGTANDVVLEELPWEFKSGMSCLTILVTNKTNRHMKYVGAMVTIYIDGKPAASEDTIVSDIPPHGKGSMQVNFMHHPTFDYHETVLRFVDF